MAVREKRIRSGKYLEIEIYSIDKTEKYKTRKKKLKESRKEQKNLNDKNAKKHLTRLINTNFNEKDIMITLTYDDDNLPSSEEEAIKDRNNFLRRVKTYRRRNGLEELKYIAVLEYREAKDNDKRTSTRIHHHIIINGMNRDILEEIWKKGRANSIRLKPGENGFDELAKYITKDTRGKKRWSQSRRLKTPDISVNDTKLSRRKLIELATKEFKREEYASTYKDYMLTGTEVYTDQIYGTNYVYIKMRKLE